MNECLEPDAIPARVGSTRVLYTSGEKYWLLDEQATEWRGVTKPTKSESRVQSAGDRLLIQGQAPQVELTLLKPTAYADSTRAG